MLSPKDIYGSFINGKFVEAGNVTDLISPLTNKPWKKLIVCNKDECCLAIDSANRAFQEWKKTPSPLRAELLRKIGHILIENKDIFAETMAMEMGKPLKDGLREVDYSAGYFFWLAGEAERIYGQIIPSQFKEKQLFLKYEPVGVCAVISPWNFPLAMAGRKIATALAAGCTVVAKPSVECPITMALFAEITTEIGLPPGVFNFLIGSEKEIGEVLLSSPIVKKLSFTGSTAVGKYLYEHSAQTLKKLTLELGGHAPLLVMDDACLEKAVKETVEAKFRNNGQTCVAPNRLLVQNKIHDVFVEKLKTAIENLRVGSPLNPNTDISNILHPSVTPKVKRHIQDALSKGAQAIIGNQELFKPTLLLNTTPEMEIFHEETFGPVLPIIRFEKVNEAIQLANQTPYGLASYAFTESLSTAQTLMDQLQYGIIGLNDGLPSTPQASFGGVKDSGFGREGGPTGIKEYLVEKYISLKV